MVIPAANESENFALLLPQLDTVLGELQLTYEVLVVVPPSELATAAVAGAHARAVVQTRRGYGGALRPAGTSRAATTS